MQWARTDGGGLAGPREAPGVLLAIDDARLRERLGVALPNWTLIACESAEEALQALDEGRAWAIVLDFARPGFGCSATLARIFAAGASTIVVAAGPEARGDSDLEFIRGALVRGLVRGLGPTGAEPT